MNIDSECLSEKATMLAWWGVWSREEFGSPLPTESRTQIMFGHNSKCFHILIYKKEKFRELL